MAHERGGDEPREHVVDGRLRLALAHELDQPLARRDELRAVGGDGELEDGRLPRLGQPARDRLADRGELDDLDLPGAPEPATAGAAAGAAAAFSTSSAMIAALRPGPVSAARSMPRSRAIRRASGDAFTRSPACRGGGRRVLVTASEPAPRRLARLDGSGVAGSASAPGPAGGAAAGAPPLPLARRRELETSSPSVPITATVVPDLDLALRDDDLEQDAVGLRLDLLCHLVGVELVEGSRF